MLEPKEWRGIWWDARNAEVTVGGVLTFSQDEAELQLLGQLGSFGSELSPFAPIDRPRICGVTTDGKEITLHRCIPRSARIGAGAPEERHHVDVILVGATYAAEEDILFDKIHFRFTHLDQWAGVSGFHSGLEWKDNKTVEAVNVTYRPPAPVTASLSDGSDISISFSWAWSGVEAVTTEARIEQRAELVVTFASPTEFSNAITIGGKLRNFLNLAVGRPVHPVQIVGVVNPPAEPEADPLTGLERRPLAIEAFYRLSDEADPADLARKVYPEKMPFSLDEVRETLGNRITTWLDKYELLKPTFDLYFGVVYGAMRYLEPRFLTLAQAVETYHRRTTAKMQLASAAGNAHPARPRKEPTLRERLQDLLQRCPQVTAKLISEPESFIDHVVKGRNYYTHYDESLQGRAPQGIKLLPLTAQLRALTEMCLLLEIGFSPSEIDAIFERSERYREVDHLLNVTAEERH
jgi:ApeA N-terminal domain 1